MSFPAPISLKEKHMPHSKGEKQKHGLRLCGCAGQGLAVRSRVGRPRLRCAMPSSATQPWPTAQGGPGLGGYPHGFLAPLDNHSVMPTVNRITWAGGAGGGNKGHHKPQPTEPALGLAGETDARPAKSSLAAATHTQQYPDGQDLLPEPSLVSPGPQEGGDQHDLEKLLLDTSPTWMCGFHTEMSEPLLLHQPQLPVKPRSAESPGLLPKASEHQEGAQGDPKRESVAMTPCRHS